jgi:hypothetical protein
VLLGTWVPAAAGGGGGKGEPAADYYWERPQASLTTISPPSDHRAERVAGACTWTAAGCLATVRPLACRRRRRLWGRTREPLFDHWLVKFDHRLLRPACHRRSGWGRTRCGTSSPGACGADGGRAPPFDHRLVKFDHRPGRVRAERPCRVREPRRGRGPFFLVYLTALRPSSAAAR